MAFWVVQARQVLPSVVQSTFDGIYRWCDHNCLGEAVPCYYHSEQKRSPEVESVSVLLQFERVPPECPSICQCQLWSLNSTVSVQVLCRPRSSPPPLNQQCSSFGSLRVFCLFRYGLFFSYPNSIVTRRCTLSTSLQSVFWFGCQTYRPYSRIGHTRLLNSWTSTSSVR